MVLPAEDPQQREALVIDSSDSAVTIDFLRDRGVVRLRLVLITHSDDDHVRGIPGVLTEYAGRISTVAFNLDRSNITDKLTQTSLLEALRRARADSIYRPVEYAVAGVPQIAELLSKDGTRFGEIIYPLPEDVLWASLSDKPNLACAVVMLYLESFRALLGGDLPLNGWSLLHHRMIKYKQPTTLSADLLLYPHHDADLVPTSQTFEHAGETVHSISSADLLNLIDPEIVVVSVGTVQPPNYQHPRNNTFELLARHRENRKSRNQSFRLACTELTTRCFANPVAMRQDALQWQRSVNRDVSLYDRQTMSCPCAGTFSIFIRPDGSGYSFMPDGVHQAFVDRIVQAGGHPGCRRQVTP